MPYVRSTSSSALEIAVQNRSSPVASLTGVPTMISVAPKFGVPGFAHHRPRAVPRLASADNTPHSAILNATVYSVCSSLQSTCLRASIPSASQKCRIRKLQFRATFVVFSRCDRLDRRAIRVMANSLPQADCLSSALYIAAREAERWSYLLLFHAKNCSALHIRQRLQLANSDLVPTVELQQIELARPACIRRAAMYICTAISSAEERIPDMRVKPILHARACSATG